MSFVQTVLLAAFAGVTIFLGLPVGRLRVSARVQVILTAAAAGVVLFLLWDILSHAVEPLADGPRSGPGRHRTAG